jgi:adenylate cyclase, class 2
MVGRLVLVQEIGVRIPVPEQSMRKEIEVKARLNNQDEVIAKLEILGCKLSHPIHQQDIVFVDDDYGVFDKFNPGKNILRIREQDDRFILTLKQAKSNEQDAIEHETEVVDAKETREILEHMGFHEEVRINKIRRTAHYNNWEICIDEVEGLGSFIEVEHIAEDPEVESVQSVMFNFLISLGVKVKDRVTNGYDTLVYRKNKK